jgi:AcrR family transcriptional regulator
MNDPATRGGLRERKKAHTRQTIQEQAIRLFLAQGYDETTVEQIAAAAGVSHMTVFRHFPTKEDLVASDDYDPMLAAFIAARPADEPLALRIRNGLLEALGQIYAADRDTLRARTQLMLSTPALRARVWDNQSTTEHLLATALTAGEPPDEIDFASHVVAAACLAVLTSALVAWADADDGPELPALIEQAFDALATGLG